MSTSNQSNTPEDQIKTCLEWVDAVEFAKALKLDAYINCNGLYVVRKLLYGEKINFCSVEDVSLFLVQYEYIIGLAKEFGLNMLSVNEYMFKIYEPNILFDYSVIRPIFTNSHFNSKLKDKCRTKKDLIEIVRGMLYIVGLCVIVYLVTRYVF